MEHLIYKNINLYKQSERNIYMKSKEESKVLLDQKNSNNEEILDCTEEIEEYIKKVIPKEDN